MTRKSIFWYLSFIFVLNISVTTANDKGRTSIICAQTDFKLLKDNIEFEGNNLFNLAIQEHLYKKEGNEYLPGSKMVEHQAGGLIWYGSNGVGLVSYDPRNREYSLYNFQEGFHPGFFVRIIHADNNYIFFTLGDFRSVLGICTYGPAFMVYSLEKKEFRRIIKISTDNGIFGKYSSELSRKYNLGIAQKGWNYEYLEQERFANIASIAEKDWGLQFPSSIKLQKGIYEISYNEDWSIEEFTTKLYVKTDDLNKEF